MFSKKPEQITINKILDIIGSDSSSKSKKKSCSKTYSVNISEETVNKKVENYIPVSNIVIDKMVEDVIITEKLNHIEYPILENRFKCRDVIWLGDV